MLSSMARKCVTVQTVRKKKTTVPIREAFLEAS
jgi:hypothetical protein